MKRRLIALLLCIAMIGSMTVYAVGDDPVCTCGTETEEHAADCALLTEPAPEPTSEPETEPETDPVCTCGTATEEHAAECALYVAPAEPTCTCGTATEEHAAECPLYVAPAEPTCTCGTATEEHAAECALYVAPAEPTCTCGTTTEEHATECALYVEPEAPSVADQLLAAASLAAFRAVMMAEENRGDVMWLTVEEIESLMAHVDALYAAIEEPSDDDTYTHEELLETLTYLPAMECPECGEFGGHLEDCVRNTSELPADGKIPAQEIKSNTTWNLNQNCNLNGRIQINSGKTLTINGNGYTITRNFTNHFMFDVYGTLILNGVTISGNNTTTGYAAIRGMSGNITLDNSTIKNVVRNTGNQKGRGGAIQLGDENSRSVNLTIRNNSVIENCTAPEGSAIMLTADCSGNVLIENSTIRNCTSNGEYCGTIRTQGATNTRVTIRSSTITGNRSNVNGGGVYWNASGTNASLTITGTDTAPTVISNNSATYGGGVFISGKDVTINNTQIIGNSAPYGGGINLQPYSFGSNSGASIDLTIGQNTLIQGNTATYGGGVYMQIFGATTTDNSNFTINVNEGATISDNTAQYGGGVALTQTTGNGYGGGKNNNKYNTFVNINDGTISGNKATVDGGAFYINRTRYTSGNYKLEVKIDGGLIEGNTAANNGGAMYIYDNYGKANVTVTGGEAKSNSAVLGGGVYVSGGNFTMTGGTFSGNEASQNGGGAYVTGGSATLSGGTLSGNKATLDGGALYIGGTGTFTMSGGAMTGNTANQNGGAVYLNAGSFTMTNGEITGNTASASGGAAFVRGGNALIEYGKINGNKAVNGGAVYMDSTTSTFTMKSGFMNENEATNDGGAIFANGGKIYIGLDACKNEVDAAYSGCTDHDTGRTHPELKENSAGRAGGGISIDNSGEVFFYCGDATTNEALYKGVGKNVFMDGGIFHMYDGTHIGAPRDPDLVVIGGNIINESHNRDLVELRYYMTNGATSTEMVGFADYKELINLPDGEYYFDAPAGCTFVGWTGQGKATGNLLYQYVRHKEQYVESGGALEILDHTTIAADETGVNTNRLFDGTNDKVIHMYALWAPITNQITYYDGMTMDKISNTAETYTFSRDPATTAIQPVEKPGYDLVGWYIYQDNDQNANWNPSATDQPYELASGDIDLDSLVYIALDDRNAVLNLATGNSNFGNITLIAKFDPAYTDLKISKTGWVGSLDENQTYIFKVTGTPTNTKLDPINMTVTIQGNGEVLIKQLPLGSYQIEEITDWSWRYSPVDGPKSVQLVDSSEIGEAKFENTRSNGYWLSGDSYARNLWAIAGTVVN